MKISQLRKRQIAVLAIGVFIWMFFKYGKPEPEQVDRPEQAAPAIEVITLKPGPVQMTVHTQGTVQPWRQIDVLAQVTGKIEAVTDNFAEGGFFQQDEVLLQVEQQNYKSALLRAEAKVADAQQVLALEEGRARQAKREWRNLKDENANALFLRKPQIQSAEANLAAAKGDVESAKLDLQRTQIKVPFAGRIKEIFVNLGQHVNTGAKVAEVFSTEKVEVRLPLTDRQIALLDLPINHEDDQNLEPVPVALMGIFAGEVRRWQGVITRTSAAIDSQSRFFYAVAEVYEPFKREADKPPLNVGQFVEAQIRGRVIDNALVLPRRALRPGDVIWLVDEDNRLRRTKVKVLQALDQQVTVQGVFPSVVNVVPSSVAGLPDGFKVSPIKQDQADTLPTLEPAGAVQ